LISHCIYKKLETAIIITPIIFLLLLCYYADAFIFSGWQRPWLSLSMFIFIAIIALIIFLINRSKRRAIEKWQKNE
jgi:uncharacterized membrane protein YbhN (UPF0104 family)